MKISLNEFDSKRIENLNVTFQNNAIVLEVLADFLNSRETSVTKAMTEEISSCYDMPFETAFAMLLASSCGLEIYENQVHKLLFNDYFLPAVKELDAKDFKDDLYLKTIKFPVKKFKNWELKFSSYEPCEAFVYDEPVLTSDFREYPQIGFFRQEFSFPAVFQDGREWMAVKPNEIFTMQLPIENAHGNVLTFGLGLGYFAFLASMKKSIKTVTVVEKNADIIELFSSEILPQFPQKEKIRIIAGDAFEFSKDLKDYDYVFSDIWHDASDGLRQYLKLKNLHSKFPDITFDYWIEKSLLSNLRYTVFDGLYKVFKNSSKAPLAQDEKIIKTYREFTDMISDKGLKNIKVNVG